MRKDVVSLTPLAADVCCEGMDVGKDDVNKETRDFECLCVKFGDGLCYFVPLGLCQVDDMLNIVSWHGEDC